MRGAIGPGHALQSAWPRFLGKWVVGMLPLIRAGFRPSGSGFRDVPPIITNSSLIGIIPVKDC